MVADEFNYRGLRIGLAGVAVVMTGVTVGGHIPCWLVFAMGLAGIGTGFVGAAIHYFDMVGQRRAEAELRKAWILQHGDPDWRDDPAERR